MKSHKNMNSRKLYLELFHSLYILGVVLIYPILIVVALINNLLKYILNKVNKKNISGQVAVVTGSGRGLGRDIAIELAKRGCHIAIVDIQEHLAHDTANYIAKNYEVKTKAYKTDVRDYYQLVKLKDSVTEDFGDVTILINNAGIVASSSMRNPSPEEIQQMINVNFTSICFTKQIFLPKMKELNYGHIVNISSISALFTYPFINIYSATKSAVRSLTASIRIELTNERKNITATTVMPSFLSTNKRIEKIANLAGFQKLLPLIEGEIVAQYVVDGMLRGDCEITVPSSMLYVYKLLEIIPACAKEILLSVLVAFDYNKIMNSKEIESIMKVNDII